MIIWMNLESVDGAITSVTLEGEVILGINSLYILYSNPTFNTTQSKPYTRNTKKNFKFLLK